MLRHTTDKLETDNIEYLTCILLYSGSQPWFPPLQKRSAEVVLKHIMLSLMICNHFTLFKLI